jgi:hypothetical protein
MEQTTVLFEPWSLGDALIAASVLRECPQDLALACDPRWDTLLRLALKDVHPLRLLPLEAPYTGNYAGKSLRNKLTIRPKAGYPCPPLAVNQVLSIRGDLRDRYLARRMFKDARVRMSGWIPFLAFRLGAVDFPYRCGLWPVKNRYRLWCDLANIPFSRLRASYAARQVVRPAIRRIVIHVGAQRRSRQYPLVADLAGLLVRDGFDVRILAAPSDGLPSGVPETQAVRVYDDSLVRELTRGDLAIVNDAGPMHLAALLGVPAMVVAHICNIQDWRPPCVHAICSENMPTGYRPMRAYLSDSVVQGWPEPETVLRRVRELAESCSAKGVACP